MIRKALVITTSLLIFSLLNPSVDARKQYSDQFKKQYKSDLSGQKLGCSVCHVSGKPKKTRNNYGQAFGKRLGKRNVKSDQDIRTSLKKTESDPSHEKNVTFGDRIRAGKLPAKPKESTNRSK